MIVRFGKIHTLTRDTHTVSRCLGRRLLLVGNIGFSRIVQTNKNFTKLIHYILQTSYKCFHTNTDTNILMISPALKLILAFKITCILRSPVDKYRCQVS